MNSKTIEDLLHIYDEPMSYYYFKDRHVIDKILRLGTDQIEVPRLKKSKYAQWLNKPILAELIRKNHGSLSRNDLESLLPKGTNYFNITFSKWGEEARRYKKDKWYQISRAGYGLVLQLNFSMSHNHQFFKLLKPNDWGKEAFACTSHPIAENRFITMAWSRLDIDFETGELLIEELQNDWLRNLERTYKRISSCTEEGRSHELYWSGFSCSFSQFKTYFNLMKSYREIWSEALLHASVQFATKELGMDTVWMHTYESGNMFKELPNSSLPPKSLYTQLPKKYGFEKTAEAPLFLKQEAGLKAYVRKAAKQKIAWHRLLKE